MKKAACVLLIRPSDGKLVVASRRGEPGDIGLPGGKVDPGETCLEAAVRELYEETGIALQAEEVVQVYVRPCLGETDYETTTFMCMADDVSPRADFKEPFEQEKGITIRWAAWDELISPENAFAIYNSSLYDHVRPILSSKENG